MKQMYLASILLENGETVEETFEEPSATSEDEACERAWELFPEAVDIFVETMDCTC